MSINGFNRSLLPIVLLSGVTLAPPQTQAANLCKGLEEPVCKESPDCVWVSSYTMKNGNSVKAYCRSSKGKAEKAPNLEEEQGRESGANDRNKPSAAIPATTSEENRG